MIKKFFLFLLLGMLLPLSAYAQTSVSVNGTVPSVVSPTLSTVTTDLTELPADGKSLVIITVNVKDAAGNPVSNKVVSISSNRGSVDVVGVYDGTNLQTGTQTTSDANGTAVFAARSNAPGKATFTVVADTVTLSTKPVITFTPLPVLQNLTVSIKIPEIIPGTTKITLVQPPVSSGQANNSQLVNTKVELQLPFFLLVIGFVIFGIILLLIIMLISIRRRLQIAIADQRKANQREEDLLKKILQLEGSIASDQRVISQNEEVINAKIDKI